MASIPVMLHGTFFAVASRGTERVLADELTELGLPYAEEIRGGVTFGATLEHGYRACLWSRVASRVLVPLVSFDARNPQEFYQGVYEVDWTSHVRPDRTLAVDVTGGPTPIGSPRFIALKTKDALVDRVRDRVGARPDVDTERPDLRVSVHVAGTRATLSIDLGGRGLHRRGIGRLFADAPLKENRAAAMLRIAGWLSRSADGLFDPFCGSGTILLEAAWMVRDVAPGLGRPRLGTGWQGHDHGLWKRLLAEAGERREACALRTLRIAGSDASREAIRYARANIARAGLAGAIRVDVRELTEVWPPWPGGGTVVTNPPYGARLGEPGELWPLYEQLGDILKRRFPGWTAWVLCGNPLLAKHIGLRPSSRHVLYNGPIECRLLEVPIATASVGEEGPGWRRPSSEAAAFARKLLANKAEREAWARDEDLTCYRLYDSDLPEYNLAVDWYAGAVRVEEYAPPRKIPAELAQRRVQDAMRVVADVLAVDPADVVLRVRRRRPAGEQHQRRSGPSRFREVQESGLHFLVNLTDYLDTGLFLDDRLLRRRIRQGIGPGEFLNLFAYTCTASVAAAAGGARSTTSLELSNVYLAWGKRNFALNGLMRPAHRFARADVVRWLDRNGDTRRYDLILLAPPTYSRSKGMRGEFDVQRDHAMLIDRCARLLSPGGQILFTTNLRGFRLHTEDLEGLDASEITDEITPLDFHRRPRIRAWVVFTRVRRSASVRSGG